MLVLSHADRFGINFNEFCQRILQSARNGNRGTLGHVEVREFFRRQLGGGINGSSRLADDHIRDIRIDFLQKLCNENFRFLGGRSVPDGNDLNAELFDDRLHRAFCLFLFVLRGRRINDRLIEYLSRFVDDSRLAPRAICGVKAEHDFAF